MSDERDPESKALDLEDGSPEKRRRWVRVGGPVKDSTASLRFFGDDLDPEEMSTLLGCVPTRAHRKGDAIPGARNGRVARTGSWNLHSVDDKSVSLDVQIDGLLSRVTADPTVWKDLRQRFRVDLFCGLFLHEGNEGFTIGIGLVQRLAERGIELNFDIYASCPKCDE